MPSASKPAVAVHAEPTDPRAVFTAQTDRGCLARGLAAALGGCSGNPLIIAGVVLAYKAAVQVRLRAAEAGLLAGPAGLHVRAEARALKALSPEALDALVTLAWQHVNGRGTGG